MKFEFEIRGIDRLEAKVRQICANLPDRARAGVLDAAEGTRKLAVKLTHSSRIGKCIKAEIIDIDTNECVAAQVFNDTGEVPWSSYAEFGTGLYVDNEGISDAIRLKRAESIPWYIHVDMVPEDFGKYGYVRSGDFWIVHGMRPHPYMKPAGFQRRHENAETVMREIHEMLMEVCGG